MLWSTGRSTLSAVARQGVQYHVTSQNKAAVVIPVVEVALCYGKTLGMTGPVTAVMMGQCCITMRTALGGRVW